VPAWLCVATWTSFADPGALQLTYVSAPGPHVAAVAAPFVASLFLALTIAQTPWAAVGVPKLRRYSPTKG
jgi:hypothetical protein